MPEKIVPKEPEHVACEVCMKQIPKDVATSAEGEEYVVHFCGLECYTKWQQSTGQHDNKK